MPDSYPPPAERRQPRPPRANLRKLMFVLPNLFTVSSIFCGVYSITLSAGEPTGDNFYRAAVAIFFGSFFDSFDGRVARLTRTQSDFGVELDSLPYVIAFGRAVAIRGRLSLVLLVYFSFYILLGVEREALFGGRRGRAARAAAEDALAPRPEPEEPRLLAEQDEVPLENAAAATASGGDD